MPEYDFQAPFTPTPEPVKDGKSKYLFIGVAVFAVALLSGGVLVWSGWKPGGKNDAQTYYISARDAGPFPFTDAVADVDVKRVATVRRQSQSGGVSGATMELYGGSGNEAVCNQEQLITNLDNLPGPRAAFASALGLSDGLVDDYIRSLKPEASSYESSEYTSKETAEPASSSELADYPSSEPSESTSSEY